MINNSVNIFSQRYYLHVQKVRAGHLSSVRALRLLLKEAQTIAHHQWPGKEYHWQRSELKALLRELLWTMMEADPDIWTNDTCAQAERQRVQVREDHHYCMRRAGIGVARSTSS